MSLLNSIKKTFVSKDGEDRASLSKKVQAAPNDPQVRQKLGMFMLRAGEVVEGLDQLARSAIIFEKDGFAGKAIAVLRQIIKHDPKNNDFQKWLVRLLAAEGLYADAHAELRRIAAEHNRFVSEDQRIEFLRQISAYMPDSPLPSLLVADIFLVQKRKLDVAKELESAISAKNSSGMHSDIADRIRALSKQGDNDYAVLELCGFMFIAIGMREEGVSFLAKVISREEEFGSKTRAMEMKEIFNVIKGGWNPTRVGAFCFSEAVSKRGEAAVAASTPAAPSSQDEFVYNPSSASGNEFVFNAASAPQDEEPAYDPASAFEGDASDFDEESTLDEASAIDAAPVLRADAPAPTEASALQVEESAMSLRAVEKLEEEPKLEVKFEVGSTKYETEDEDGYEDDEGIVRDALGRLQAKVHEEIGDSDLDARYNLGIAYKEMGLLDEAINEFRLSMRKPDLLVGASSLLADTLAEQGYADGALAVLDEALGVAVISETQRRDLQYHKAVLLSLGGREVEAGSLFIAIADKFPRYRDVEARAKKYRS